MKRKHRSAMGFLAFQLSVCACSSGSGCRPAEATDNVALQLDGLLALPDDQYAVTLIFDSMIERCDLELPSGDFSCETEGGSSALATLDGELLTMRFASKPPSSGAILIESGSFVFASSFSVQYETDERKGDCSGQRSRALVTIPIPGV